MLAFTFGSEERQHSSPKDGKLLVGCLLLRSEVNTAPEDGKLNDGCLSLRSEVNNDNIRLCKMVRYMSDVCFYVRK